MCLVCEMLELVEDVNNCVLDIDAFQYILMNDIREPFAYFVADNNEVGFLPGSNETH